MAGKVVARALAEEGAVRMVEAAAVAAATVVALQGLALQAEALMALGRWAGRVTAAAAAALGERVRVAGAMGEEEAAGQPTAPRAQSTTCLPPSLLRPRSSAGGCLGL